MNATSIILLVGYRATGKSTCGRLLAQRLGWRFVDMDDTLRERLGADIDQVVRERGWEAFREEEKRLLKEIVSSPIYTNSVVATGGGVVLHEEVWDALPPHVLTVWLKASPSTISKRMAMDSETPRNRPPLTGAKDPFSEIEDVLAHRAPLYGRFSRVTIDVNHITPQEAVERILAHAR